MSYVDGSETFYELPDHKIINGKRGIYRIMRRFTGVSGKKKSLSIMAGIMCLCLIFSGVRVKAEENPETDIVTSVDETESDVLIIDGLKFKIDRENGTACACGASGSLSKLVIPGTIPFEGNNIPVTEIADYAFEDSTLKSVKIGENVVRIGEGAFAFCPSLKKAAFPLGCKEIGDAAFFMCNSLADIDIGSATGITYIGEGAFAGTALDDFLVPDKTEEIGASAFAGCASMRSITIGKKCSWIGDGAFSGCSALSSITVSGKNKYLSCKDGCLYSFDGTILLSAAAVSGELVLPEGLTAIQPYAFEDNTRVSFVVLPNSLEELSEYSFYNCTGLKKIKLSDNITFIGDNAFSGCTGLKTITIPAACGTVQGNPFKYCTKLSKIKVAKGNKNYKAVKGMLTSYDKKTIIAAPAKSGSYTLYSKCRSIGDFAFCGNTKLEKLELNTQFKTIGAAAFYDCKGLKYIFFPNSGVSLPESEYIEDIYTEEMQYCPVFGECSSGLEINIPFEAESGAKGSLEYLINLHTGGKAIITAR